MFSYYLRSERVTSGNLITFIVGVFRIEEHLTSLAISRSCNVNIGGDTSVSASISRYTNTTDSFN